MSESNERLIHSQRRGDGFHSLRRKAVFVGDFVNRGPAIGDVIQIVRGRRGHRLYQRCIGGRWQIHARLSSDVGRCRRRFEQCNRECFERSGAADA